MKVASSVWTMLVYCVLLPPLLTGYFLGFISGVFIDYFSKGKESSCS